jgi:hypothetical protein
VNGAVACMKRARPRVVPLPHRGASFYSAARVEDGG